MFDIGRIPRSVSATRKSIGDGAILTSRIRPREYPGHPASSMKTPLNGIGHSPLSDLRSILGEVKTASSKRAYSSLATPTWLRRSPRFGVMERSRITSSSPRYETAFAPRGASAGRRRIPNSSPISGTPSSSAESIIPKLSTPSKSRIPIFVPSEIVAPGAAYATTSPFERFVAAVTHCASSPPRSSFATKSDDFAGCASISRILPILTPDSFFPGLVTDSTSLPVSVSLSQTFPMSDPH